MFRIKMLRDEPNNIKDLESDENRDGSVARCAGEVSAVASTDVLDAFGVVRSAVAFQS